MTGTYIQMAAAFIFVIILMLGSMFILRKKQNKTGRLMNIIGYQSFGPKKGVAALKVGGEVLILGITSNEMRLLRVFKEDMINAASVGDFHSKLDKFNIENALK